MLTPTWPLFPFDLDVLGGLSDEPAFNLYVSPRTLYVLQNAVQNSLINPRAYAEEILNEHYVPTAEHLPGWTTFLATAYGLERDIVEVEMVDFNLRIYQGQAIDTIIYNARYSMLGDLTFASIMVGANSVGLAGYGIVLDQIPPIIYPKSAVLIGSGKFFDAGVGFLDVSAHAYGACGDKVVFISDGATNYLGLMPAITVAVGDAFYLNWMYERC